MSGPTSVLDKAGFYILTICGVLSPISYGSNTPTAAGLIGVSLAVCLLASPLVPEPAPEVRRLLGALMLISGLLILWTIVQILPWHAIAIKSYQPIPRLPDLRLQPLHSIGYVLIPFAAFMASLIYIRDDARCMTFLHILLGAGFAMTILSIVEYSLSPQTLLLRPKHHYLESFTGTFVNPNTAATYFGIMLLLSLSLCLRQLGYMRRQGHMVRTPARNPGLLAFLVYALWTIAFAIALLLTRSRAGILSSITAVVGFTCVYVFENLNRRRLPALSVGIATLSTAVVVILLFAQFAERVIHRVQTMGILDNGRLCTYQSTWQAIQEHFWLGTGLGSFPDIFPAYRSPQCGMNGFWEMAHSVYLEGWLSLGVQFIVILAITYFQLLKTYAYGYRHRHRFRFVPLASLSTLVLLSLHSLVDFSLQILGVAVVAALALGNGAAVSLAPRTLKEARPGRMSPPP